MQVSAVTAGDVPRQPACASGDCAAGCDLMLLMAVLQSAPSQAEALYKSFKTKKEKLQVRRMSEMCPLACCFLSATAGAC